MVNFILLSDVKCSSYQH